jgi:AcrR family transcriptional regulator
MTVSSRPYHHGNLRPALLAAAEGALARGDELSLRSLAREVGVSHAAPRRHFADKQALLDALAEDGFERLGAEMRAAIAGAGPGFRARLTALARTYVRFATEHATLLDLMYAGKHRSSSLEAAADAAFAAPLELIEEAQAAGEIVGGDLMSVAAVAWACFHGLASMGNGGLLGDMPAEALVEVAVERLVDGLAPR